MHEDSLRCMMRFSHAPPRVSLSALFRILFLSALSTGTDLHTKLKFQGQYYPGYSQDNSSRKEWLIFYVGIEIESKVKGTFSLIQSVLYLY